ncbi:MAG: dethiobiotin synthase [Aquabacterium sp.]|nr:MAG: dethiobiotin synthase [Aquabacterium sp.]
MRNLPPASFFVTGTDTGVGKSRVAAALLHALARSGRRVVGMKPVAAGAEQTERGWSNEDVAQLRAASNVAVRPELDNPYLLPDPLSPHLAAERAGRRIDPELLASRYAELAGLADAVVVEGAGGFIVPLNDTQTSADFALRLGLPLILVVGLRLGCLNHALLTQEAIAARGLKLAGWVANRIDPQMLAADENLATLKRLLRAPLLADWPWDPSAGADRLDITLPPA